MSRAAKTNGAKDDGKVALVPRLRFPEFRGTEQWEEKTLGSIASFTSGGTPSKDNPQYWNGSIPWVSASSMYDAVVEKADHYVTPLAIGNGTRIAKKGSILILVRGSMLFNRVPICVAGVDVAFNQDVKALDVDASVDTNFLLHQLSSFQARFPINETGIGAGKIELDHLKEFALFIPNKTEQQKIAECLSSVDEVIAAQARKVGALKTNKKGLMQQLFPREGQTQARLRFPEFHNDGEWECEVLANIARISSGVTPLRSNSEFFVGGAIPWVKTTDLNNSYITETEELITPIARARVNPVGSILVAMYGGFNQIGRTGFLSFPAATNQALAVLVLNENRAMPAYVLAWLNAKVLAWKRIASSSRKDPNITSADVAKFPICLPSLPEQLRIADCLSSLDALIAAETQKLDAVKHHKRALMQQLFPAPESAQE